LLSNPFLTIAAANNSYNVVFGDAASHLLTTSQVGNSVIIIDENVARLHKERLGLASLRLPILELTAHEANKSLSGVQTVLRFLLSNNGTRTTRAMVIGGGIIQDISAFACHSFFRGIEWDFYPTTVLSMADSCIGSKSGLNFDNTKNLVGVFENPRLIVIDTKFTETLLPSEIISGLGEVLKLALISGEESVERYKANWPRGLPITNLEQLIRDALSTKKPFIEQDEFDHGVRRILNYGHTFGHALESVTNYAIPHGQAVVVGMDLVNFLAVKYQFMSYDVFNRVHQLITDRFLIKQRLGTDQIAAFITAAARDKKRTSQGLNLAILNSPGQWSIEPFTIDKNFTNTVESYFTSAYSIVGLSDC
jgi:3-dehydroquinate synthase